jgi:arylsulfatase A-like enzyme
LNQVIDRLKKLWIYDNTTIICFSDHWEDLNWLYPNDKWWAALWHPEEKWHWCLLYDQTQKVLLTIKDSMLDKKWINIDNQVRLVDLMPTVLELFNFKEKINLDWTSLINILNNSKLNLMWYSETYYPEEQKGFPNINNKKSIRIENEFKTIFNLDSDNIEIYDLVKDPNESKNIFK